MYRSTRSMYVVLSLALTGVTAIAGNNSWTLTGPPSGQVHTLAIHPTNANIVLASGNRGVFRSTDGGATFSMIPSEFLNIPQQLLFDPSSPNRVVARDGLIYLSEDSGATFTLAQSPEVQNSVNQIAMGGNGVVYAATYTGHFYKATLPFAAWTEIARGWSLNNSPRALAVNPGNSDIIYAAVEGLGVMRTDNASAANGNLVWTGPLNNGLSGTGVTVYQLAVHPTRPTHVFAATGWGLYRSTNSGAAWSVVDSAPTQHITFDPNDADRIIATRGINQQSRSSDGGATFQAFGPELRVNGMPEAHFANSSSRVLYATERGVGLSVDSGAILGYPATGIIGGNATRVVMANDGLVFVAQPSGFNDIFLRRDPAVSSTYLAIDGLFGIGPVTTNVRQVYSLAVAPNNSNVLFAVNGTNQLVRTFDRGATFTAPHPAFTTGSATDYITDVQIAPGNPLDPVVAYVTRAETGVWKTTNGGGTFTRLMTSPNFAVAIGVHPANTSILYLAGGGVDGSGVLKSIDGGATWAQQIAPGTFVNRVFNGFAFDPVDVNTVYALAWGGVMKTVNGGANWTQMSFSSVTGSDSPAASAMLIDPLYPSTMIMVNATNQPGFLRTVDGGATWSETAMNLPGRDFTLNRAAMTTPGHIVAAAGTGIAEYTVAPDLVLGVSSIPASLPLGTNYPVTFTITNNSNHDSTASVLTITRPNWLTPVVPGNCTSAAQTLTCNFGVLRANASTQQTIEFAVATAVSGDQFTALLSGRETDSDTSSNRIDRTVTASEIIDLDLTFAATPSTIDNGQMTEFVATLVNNGPSPATNVTLHTTGVINFIYQSVFPSRGSCTIGAFPTCSFGTVPAGGTVTVRMGLIGQTPGDFEITGAVAATGPDSDNQQNTATQTIRVRPVGDVSLFLAESADPVVLDAPLQYVATVRRLAGDTATSQLTIAIAGATVASATTSAGTCTTAAGSVTCTMDPPSAGATVTINLGTAVPGIATATATLVYPGTDTVPGNNTATIGTTIRRTADLAVSLARSTAATSLNTEYTYTATVRNDGPNAAPAQLIIPLINATVAGVTGNGGTCTTTTNSVDCTQTQIANGGSWEIVVRASTPTPATSQASATVSSSAFDPDTSDNLANAEVVVSRIGDLSVTMTESTDPAITGTAFNYIATVNNLGPNAGGVQISVPVTGATVTGATPSAGTCTTTASQVTCEIPTFNNGSTATVRIDVNAAAIGTAQAVATVTFSGTDPVATNNSVTVSTSVNAPPPGGASGGGGGGGRFDWLALGALAALVTFTRRRRMPAQAI